MLILSLLYRSAKIQLDLRLHNASDSLRFLTVILLSFINTFIIYLGMRVNGGGYVRDKEEA